MVVVLFVCCIILLVVILHMSERLDEIVELLNEVIEKDSNDIRVDPVEIEEEEK